MLPLLDNVNQKEKKFFIIVSTLQDDVSEFLKTAVWENKQANDTIAALRFFSLNASELISYIRCC